MSKKRVSQATIGSKKAVEGQTKNTPILTMKEERTKYQTVAAGECPHDGASLLAPVKTKGVGVKYTCSQCQHTWYINKKIKTCGCLTCKKARRNALERATTPRIIRRMPGKDGGPFWTRTRDPSIIRTVL